MNADIDHEAHIYRMVHELTAVPVDQIRPAHNLTTDLGMDSVAQMELVGMFVEELGLDLDLEDTVDIRTVQDLVDLAGRRLT